MDKARVLIACLVLTFAASIPAHADQKAQQIYKQMCAASGAVRSLAAEFSETITSNDKTNRLAGRILILKPLYLRQDFWPADANGQPMPHSRNTRHGILACDGTTYWAIGPDGTLDKSPAQTGNIGSDSDVARSDMSSSIFFGLAGTGRDLMPTLLRYAGTARFDDQICRELVADESAPGNPSHLHISILVAPDNLFRRLSVDEAGQGGLTFELHHVRTNIPLTKADFAFTPPAWAKPGKKESSTGGQSGPPTGTGQANQSERPKVTMDRQSARLLKAVTQRMHAIRTLTAEYNDRSRYGAGPWFASSSTVMLMKPNYARILQRDDRSIRERKRSKVIQQLSVLADLADSDGTDYWELWDTWNKFYNHHAVDAQGHNVRLYGNVLYGDFFDPSQSIYSRMRAGTVYSTVRAVVYNSPLSSITAHYQGNMASHGERYNVVRAYFTVIDASNINDETWLFYIGQNGLIDRVSCHLNLRSGLVEDEEYTLSNVQINVPLSRSDFAFKVPPGYRARS